MTVQLHLGDCLEFMRGLPDGCVDCVFVDLPYFEIAPCEWDKQWENRDAYLDWVCSLAEQWKRITKTNSSVFVFCDEKTEAYLQVRLDAYFLLLNKIVWFKPNALPQINAHLLRTFAPMTERALFYASYNDRCEWDTTGWQSVKLDPDNFKPLRDYFREYQEAIGLNIKQINARLGHRKAEHAFYWGTTQWDLPTQETYDELEKLPSNHGFVRREYEDLRREYEDLRRPFNADGETLDVISWPIINSSENTDHPTTKPLGLCKRILSVITKDGNTILDCCMGSGTTGVAAVQLGRNFIGVEIDETYFKIAERRIREAEAQPPLFVLDTPRAQQLTLEEAQS